MATKEDKVQVTVLVDGKQGINELGKLEMQAYELRNEIKLAEAANKEFERKSKELEKVGDRYEKLKTKLTELLDAGKYGSKEYENVSKSLKKVEDRHKSLTKEVESLATANQDYINKSKELDGVNDKVKKLRDEMGLTGMTMKQLRNYQRQLNNEVKNLTKGTARYNEVKAKVQEVNKVIEQQRNELRGLGGMWSSIKTEVKQFGILAAGYLGFEFITGQIGNIIRGNAKLSDSMADIRKTTGMTTEEVKQLNSELGKIDTRTSNSALREIAIVGGQIGVAKEEMLGFVEATDMAVVALGDEFTGGAEEVAREIGSLQRLFKETKDLDAGQAIREIGSALNELGAAGSATAPEVADFTKRLGALGELAPKISESLGFGAAFQELGLTAERSSSGLSSILLEAAGSADKFASMMGKSKEEVEGWINTDPNKFILELAKRFEGLSQTQATQVMAELGITSQESIKVMSLLADKTDFVREKQELAAKAMQENTSLQEENNVKQATFGALIDRVSKKINSMVNNQGFVEFLTAAAENAYKLLVFLKEIPTFLDRNKNSIKGITIALGALAIAYIAFNKTKQKAIADYIVLEFLILKEAAAKRIALISTINLTTAQKGLNTAMKTNPIGFVIGLVVLLVGAFAALYTSSQTVRAGVNGIFNVLKEFGSYIKNNFMGIFEGLALIMESFESEFDGKKLAKGIAKTLTSAFNLTGAGGLLNLAKDGGKSMADAFNQGYNEQIMEEDRAKRPVGWGAKAPGKAYNPLDSIALQQPKKPDAPATKEESSADEENRRKAAEFLRQKEREKNAKKAAKEAEKAREERERLAEEEANRRLEMKRMLEDLELSVMEEGAEKKRQQTQLAFERELEDLIANKKYSAEIEKALKAKLHQDLAEIDKQEKERKLKEALTGVNDQANADTLSADTQFQEEEYLAKLQSSALLELEAEHNHQQALLEIKRQALEEELRLRDENGSLTAFQRQQLEENLKQITIAGKQETLAYERAIAQTELAMQQQKYAAAATIVQEYGNIITDMMSLVGASGAEMAEFQKALTLVQIMIDTAAAISSLTKSSEENQLNGVTFGLAGVAQFAAGIARITGNVAKAKSLISSAKPPQPPSFYYGGGTGSAGLGFGDKYGEFSGYVHKNEYVIPAITRKDPQVANYEALIESKRTGLRAPAIAQEKAGNASETDDRVVRLLQNMLLEQQASRQALQTFPTRLKADVSLNEYETAQKTMQQLKDETEY